MTAPLAGSVQPRVLGSTQYQEVLWIVVQTVVVNVMNDLPRPKLAPQHLLHNSAVLGDLHTVDARVPVTALYPSSASTPAVMALNVQARMSTGIMVRCRTASTAALP
jgi:hypothetical protein